MMNDLTIEVVANRDHRAVVERFLSGRPYRVRIYAFNIHDIQLNSMTLRSRIFRLLASEECTVTVAYGASLLRRDRQEARDETSRQVLEFLHDLEAHGARVYHVPRPMLHAKVLYIEERLADNRYSSRALVSSANFTEPGIGGSNYELGISLHDLESRPSLKNKIKEFTNGVLGRARSLEQEGG